MEKKEKKTIQKVQRGYRGDTHNYPVFLEVFDLKAHSDVTYGTALSLKMIEVDEVEEMVPD